MHGTPGSVFLFLKAERRGSTHVKRSYLEREMATFTKTTMLLSCCGARGFHGFPTAWYAYTSKEEKQKIRSVDAKMKKDIELAPNKPFHLAILNDIQKPYLHDILEKHGFKVIRKQRNGHKRYGRMCYLYCRVRTD